VIIGNIHDNLISRNVGGSYGQSNMRDMMLEIKKNGPIVVR
jgi:hypothetical protein